MKIQTGGKTVSESKAEKVLALVESGMTATEAAASLGTTMAALRNRGGLSALTKRLLENVADADLLNETNQRMLARARLVELALQDEDMKTAVSASRALSGADTPVTATQVNVNYTPEIIAALKSLGLVNDDDKREDRDVAGGTAAEDKGETNGTDGNV